MNQQYKPKKQKKEKSKSKAPKLPQVEVEADGQRPRLRGDEKVVATTPLVYSWQLCMYEKTYYDAAHLQYPHRIYEKRDDEKWTEFFKRVQAERINAEKAKEKKEAKHKAMYDDDVICVAGPFPSTSGTGNAPNSIDL
ncbi:hypothetical protein L3Y34_012813 [Caenorhabditis briggsae]|uniref:Uncharacterized protein n=1 Tax=Caenorhabditis briggsae TaxID=6238 RepID=A0AAE8ZTD1_CAEBR|nr:hypothetical protein L3Y34_012813 [Caenorhabditis briggsae]